MKKDLLDHRVRNRDSISNSIIRFTGRHSLAPLPFETKATIVLDPYHPLTKLIILNIHEENKHIGYKHTLTELRQRF